MAKPSYLSGHTHTINRPCTVYGVYNDKTGTVLLEYVWCDGTHYDGHQLHNEDYVRLMLELRQHILDMEIPPE